MSSRDNQQKQNNAGSAAPGAPGARPTWTSSAKQGLGTSLSGERRCWFTIGRGIVNEVYWPRVDSVAVRDVGFVITEGADGFYEDKVDAEHELSCEAEGIPLYRVVSTGRTGAYRLEKEVLASPRCDCLLQRLKFSPLRGGRGDFRLYVLVACRLANAGSGNRAWVADGEGTPMLLAEHEGDFLAVACSSPFVRRSVGFVGVSDGWQDLHAHKRMTWEYARADGGNVALTAELDLRAARGHAVLAMGFGDTEEKAARAAAESLRSDFEKLKDEYVTEWRDWQRSLKRLKPLPRGHRDLARTSAAVLRTMESSRHPGGIIASLSIPWGFARGDDDPGGYHLVWTRDLVEMAGGMLAIGAFEDARRALRYLEHTQDADGHWSQNMWIDGTPHWSGIQMDETALPILLMELAHREGALSRAEIDRLWPMTRRAAGYLVRNGPATQEGRWEHNSGYSPYTLAVEIAALLTAAQQAESLRETSLATYLRETADLWNASIEDWTYVTGTDLASRVEVPGYYMWIAPPGSARDDNPAGPGRSATENVSPDALALVRFGLRSPEDPRIRQTIKVIDTMLRTETPAGPCWHRYTGDQYGEHEDGSPFDGKTGRGRLWPVLAGERAHYELAAGHREPASAFLRALGDWANEGGLIPEQIWDSADIPERLLFFGRPTGSAMPLGWAHAEYLKLRRSLLDGEVFDMPELPRRRYLVDRIGSHLALWRFDHQSQISRPGKTLRVETHAPAVVRYSTDGWQSAHDVSTRDTRLSMYVADLPTGGLPEGSSIAFTFYWPQARHWEGRDFEVQVAMAPMLETAASR